MVNIHLIYPTDLEFYDCIQFKCQMLEVNNTLIGVCYEYLRDRSLGCLKDNPQLLSMDSFRIFGALCEYLKAIHGISLYICMYIYRHN